MSIRQIIYSIVGGLFLLTLIVVLCEGFGSNNSQDWQILQTPGGTVTVIDTPGYYWTSLGRVWTYPRNTQVEYDKDYAFKVVFNDGGKGTMNVMIRFSAPLTAPAKLAFHQQFGGNMANVEAAVWAHISNAMKSTAPIMSASEHQSARQSEFNQLVQEQLNAGLYETKKVSLEEKDTTDSNGKPITVYATEIINDSHGKPRILNPSPLAALGITITQFSVTHVDYDEQTKTQFETKKAAFLAAESSKAQREKEVQERLMVEERGKREKAENEAAANKAKATAVIAAQQEQEVQQTNANRDKSVAETMAAQKVAVALQTKAEAETKAEQEKSVAETAANRDLDVARLQRQAAEENAKKQVALAEAQAESLKVAGAISEHDRVLAQIAADRDVQVAAQLAKVAVPSFIITGGSGADGKATDVNSQLMNVFLLKQTGLLK